MALDYEQYLSDDLKELYKSDKYSDLRNLIVKGCDDTNDGLVFAVRKNEIHIYYRGGRLLKITQSANGKSLKLYTDPKYAGDKDDPENEIVKLNKKSTVDGAGDWYDNFENLKTYVANYYRNEDGGEDKEGGKGNGERLLQHRLELNNRDFNTGAVVIDNEYGVRVHAVGLNHLSGKNFGAFTQTELGILESIGLSASKVMSMSAQELNALRLEYKLCKVDLVTLFKGDDGKYKICLTELKKGYGSTSGSAGIDKHIDDFKVFIKYRKADIVKSVQNLINYKTGGVMNTIFNKPGDFVLDEENIYVSILCYDLENEGQKKGVMKKINTAIENGAKEALPHFHYNVQLKSDNLKLTREKLLADK